MSIRLSEVASLLTCLDFDAEPEHCRLCAGCRCVRQWSGKGSESGSVWSVEVDGEPGEGLAPKAPTAAAPAPVAGSSPPLPPSTTGSGSFAGPSLSILETPPLFDVKKAIALLMVCVFAPARCFCSCCCLVVAVVHVAMLWRGGGVWGGGKGVVFLNSLLSPCVPLV
jgi:hypothetical protein